MIGQKDLGMALMTTSLANSVSKNGEIDESIWGAAQNPSQNLGLIWFNGDIHGNLYTDIPVQEFTIKNGG